VQREEPEPDLVGVMGMTLVQGTSAVVEVTVGCVEIQAKKTFTQNKVLRL